MAQTKNPQADGAIVPLHQWSRLRAVMIAGAIVAVYLVALSLSFTEANRRSLTLVILPPSADYLQMNINVAHVDPARSEITTQIAFRVAGKLAQDSFRPSTNLQLVINTINGQRQFDLPKGKRIDPIEAVFPLDGDANLYPFDKRKAHLWFFVAIPGRQAIAPKPPAETAMTVLPTNPEGPTDLAVSASDLEQQAQAATKIVFTASIPGLMFRQSKHAQNMDEWKGLSGIELTIARSPNVIIISVITMLMMAALSLALFVMALKVIAHRQSMDNFHIPVAVSLIFGLPALRNIQPGIPPPGTFGDTLVFTWAEIVAAASAVTLMANWAFHRQRRVSSLAKTNTDGRTPTVLAGKSAVNISVE